MNEGNDKLSKGLSGEGEGGGSLFSFFRPAPAAPAPPPPVKTGPSVRETPELEARLSGIEKKLEEAALKKTSPLPPQDREILEYLKVKITELEEKLRGSKEKEQTAAAELKAIEGARERSGRELEAFLAELKKQRSESGAESERSLAVELEKAGARIKELELRLLELSAPRPRPEIPAAEFDKLRSALKAELELELDRLGLGLAEKIAAENSERLSLGFEKLGKTLAEKITKENAERLSLAFAALGRELAEKMAGGNAERLTLGFEKLGKGLAEKMIKENSERLSLGFEKLGKTLAGRITKENAERLALGFAALGRDLPKKVSMEAAGPLAARLDEETRVRGKDMDALRGLACAMNDRVAELETSFSKLENVFIKKSAETDALFAGFSSQLKAAREAAGRENAEFRAQAGASFEKVSGLGADMGAELCKLTAAMEEFRSGLRAAAVRIEASRAETSELVEGFKRALQAGGGAAADAEVRKLAAASGPYDLGFITACFDNLENAVSAAAETLARTGAAAGNAAAATGAEGASLAHRQAALLDAAARDLGAALGVFRGVREEALKPVKKILGG